MIIASVAALLVAVPLAAGVPSGVFGAAGGKERVAASEQADYSDAQRGVSAVLPSGWHAAGKLTSLGFPREVITLASYPLQRGGGCGPERALADLPADGALIFVFEYRPSRGAVWTNSIERASFPPRPAQIQLPRKMSAGSGCFAKPGYRLHFRDADRPLQVMIAMGPKAGTAQRRTVRRVLNDLRFAALPAPPPDPYAGWPTLTDESGDSLRVPPRWTSLVTAIPRRVPRPRTLFLTASQRLAGLPADRRRTAALPAPAATPGLGRLAADAVVLWLTEERRGGASPAFRAFARSKPWPSVEDFKETAAGPAKQWPALTWRRAGLSWRGLRFTAWIAAGPKATQGRIALAQQAAVSVGLSSRLRDCAQHNRRGACRRPLQRRLKLRRQPYLGVGCTKANSIACDRVKLAVWLRAPARKLTASIDRRTFTLRPPTTQGGYWEGTLKPAGLLTPGSALEANPDRRRYYWAGRNRVRAVVRLSATTTGGASARADVTVDLHPGYG